MGTELLEIIAPGPLTCVQDLGRFGCGHFGVPPSGALDSVALRIGNLLVGNPEGQAGLEITLPGFKAKVLADTAAAVTGGDLRPCRNGIPLPMWSAEVLRRGDVLHFRGLRSGCRAYLAVGGGVDVPEVMGSRSTSLGSGFGGFQGRALKKGDVLSSIDPGRHLAAAGRSLAPERIPAYAKEWLLRAVPGPQEEQFTAEARALFCAASFKVTPHSDRTGIRLAGPRLETPPGTADSIISEGVVPGAVQVPGDCQPIILLNETVTGGYRKIAAVISADLHLLGQVKPGDRVTFQLSTLAEARAALQALERQVREVRQRFAA